MRGWMMLGLAVVALGRVDGAAAQTPCAVPAGLAGFTTPTALPRGRTPALRLGRAATVPLSVDARLVVKPVKPAAAGTRAGVFVFSVAKAGRYRVAVDQPSWIEVARGGFRYNSVAHGHAPACSGARTMVDYDLTPGDHVLQLSDAARADAVVEVVAL